MEKETLKEKIVGAHCPHCRTSLLEKGKIVNHFHRSFSGSTGRVLASIKAGDYTKEVKKEFGEEVFVLEKNEKVKFFCQYCGEDLNFKFNDNIFIMNIETENGEVLEVIRSTKYDENFTVIIKNKRKYYYGNMTAEKQEEIEKNIERMQKHYSKGVTMIP